MVNKTLQEQIYLNQIYQRAEYFFLWQKGFHKNREVKNLTADKYGQNELKAQYISLQTNLNGANEMFPVGTHNTRPVIGGWNPIKMM